ncbi:MAG: hypothetical protein QGG40_04120 [Myxococcota bacterium]|jgi:hypothetical protein|nr:hypothetical protein [Myxococcota bacterium]
MTPSLRRYRRPEPILFVLLAACTGGSSSKVADSGDKEASDSCPSSFEDAGSNLQGYLGLNQSGEWTQVEAFFYDTTSWSIEEEELDPLDGMEDCGLWADAIGVGTIELISAGDITIQLPDEAFTMSWGSTGTTPDSAGPDTADTSGQDGYPTDTTLEERSLQMPWGETLGIEATGSDFPSFELDPAACVPRSSLEVTTPTFGNYPDYPTTTADGLTVTWSGAAEMDTIELELTAYGDRYYRALCRATDDGTFEIPADILAQFPTPGTFTLEVRRVQQALHEISQDAALVVRTQSRDRGKVDLVED